MGSQADGNDEDRPPRSGLNEQELEYITNRPTKRAQPTKQQQSHKYIPDTPCAVSVVSFLLGGLCFLSLSNVYSKFDVLLDPGLGTQRGSWWATPQLGLFVGALSCFHWAEFAVTAGWNRERCSVDCRLLCLSLRDS